MVTILNNEKYDFLPDAGRSYSIGWKMDHFEWFIVPLVMFAIAYGVFVAGPISYRVNWVFLKAIRGERIGIKDIFMVFQKNYWNAVVANIVVGVIVGLGIVMLIVPGIIFACRLAFVPYLVIDRDMGGKYFSWDSWPFLLSSQA